MAPFPRTSLQTDLGCEGRLYVLVLIHQNGDLGFRAIGVASPADETGPLAGIRIERNARTTGK